MINFIIIAVALTTDLLILASIHAHFTICNVVIASITSLIIFVIWIGVEVCAIGCSVKDQLTDFNKLRHQDKMKDAVVENFKEDKITHETALERYKEESKVALVDNYKKFEETLMKNIQDSKLLAAVLQKSGYSKVLGEYHTNIVKLTDKITNCDVAINTAVASCDKDKLAYVRNLLSRQGRGIFGYHFFFPKNLIYKEGVSKEV